MYAQCRLNQQGPAAVPEEIAEIANDHSEQWVLIFIFGDAAYAPDNIETGRKYGPAAVPSRFSIMSVKAA